MFVLIPSLFMMVIIIAALGMVLVNDYLPKKRGYWACHQHDGPKENATVIGNFSPRRDAKTQRILHEKNAPLRASAGEK